VLVLTRKKNEIIKIGDNITVTIVSTNGYQVKVGIEAPPDVAVDRLELWEAKQRTKNPRP
jgi:carbon storage regulator